MSKSWELHVKRIGLQSRPGEKTRTYGTYEVIIDGAAVPELSGHICESIGPGDNTITGKNKRRIHEGTYPLSTQFGTLYSSADFTSDSHHPMPGFLLIMPTNVRDGILVHPGHPPSLYLSSIGCFNPTNPLSADQFIDFPESRARVIAMIDSLKAHDPAAFAHKISTRIANARAVVEGEPMTPVAEIPNA